MKTNGCLRVRLVCLTVLLLASAPVGWSQDSPVDGDRVEKLIKQLGHDDFFERERAEEQLYKLGADGLDALNAATMNEDIEIASRARYLVLRIRTEWTRDDDSVQVKQLLKDYDGLNDAAKVQRFEALANLADDAGLAALCRLARFEKSDVLSKHAALKVIARKPPNGADLAKRKAKVHEALGRSTAPAANWLRAHVEHPKSPEAVLFDWGKLVADEQAVASTTPQKTQAEIVSLLMRRQVELLQEHGKPLDAKAVMLAMLDYEKGTAATLPALLEWLSSQQAWEVIDAAAVKFADRFEQQPLLLYTLVQLQAARGKPELAETEQQKLMVRQLLTSYENYPEAIRLTRMNSLAAMPDDGGLTALCCLLRFEKSPILGRQAAMRVLNLPVIAQTNWGRREHVIRGVLTQTNSVGAKWLLNYVNTRNDPQAAVTEWAALIAEEETALAKSPAESTPDIVATLLKRQVERLDQLGRKEEAEAAVIRVARIFSGDEETLPAHLDWLLGRKSWSAIDITVDRFTPIFVQQSELLYKLIKPQLVEKKADQAEALLQLVLKKESDAAKQQPMIWYTMAEILLAQGKSEQAEQQAQKGFETRNGDQPEALQTQHYPVARELQLRNLSAWARREYKYVIELGPPSSLYTFVASTSLSEMLHDEDDDLGAAKALQTIVDEMDRNEEFRQTVEQRLKRDVPGIKSRMHFFYASHYEAMKDSVKQAEQLEKAVAQDPTDADALIALYRLPNQDDARKSKTLELIKAATVEFRSQMEKNPADSTPYNQLAWLVSNTEGDQAEALRCSQKSLELRPNTAGYLDTLGRCYYAQKDYANAVRFQSQAVELDPSSVQMKRQLALFKEALEKSP